MEFGNSTTLFYPENNGEDLSTKAKDKEMGRPYQKKESEWSPGRTLFLMDDEELKTFGEEKTAEMQELMKDVFTPGLAYEDSTIQELPQMKLETATAREAAIAYDGVKIMALSGQETILSEYLGEEISHRVWEFEPHPDFEAEVAKKRKGCHSEGPTLNMMEKADEDKLWQFLETTVEEIKKEKGLSLDIKNLTPYQAVLVIEELMKKRLNYEHLIGSKDMIAVVKNAKEHGTSRKDLLELAQKEPEKFEKSVADLDEKIDHMSADQLLEFQFGVCRHIAATSQKLYEVLRERQNGLLMNGSYMIYHNEGLGEQTKSRLIENHAYNILVVTTPGEGNKTEVSLSVLDPTWRLNSKRYDYTYQRISQTISFLTEYGDKLGVENKVAVCQRLAAMAGERLRGWMVRKEDHQEIKDYAALLVQTGKDSDEVIHDLKEVYIGFGYSQVDFILDMFEIPAISSVRDNERVTRGKFNLSLAKEIAQYQFNGDPEMEESSEELRKAIDRDVSQKNPNWQYFTNPGSFDVKKDKFNNEDEGGLAMINELVRASVELNVEPSKKAQGIIKKAAALERRARTGIINLNMTERLMAMIVKHGAK
jgi:hypothetical protein